MVQFIQNKNPDSNEILDVLRNIPRSPGTCIYIDIADSTKMKYEHDIGIWGKKLNNTFNFISFLNDFPENIIKGIGDEIMLYIPDDVLRKKQNYNNHYALLEEIYATIFNIKSFPEHRLFANCKVAVHFCMEAYNISFLEGFNDYYGRDIDLTARLMSITRENRIVISNAYYYKMSQDLEQLDIKLENTCLKYISKKQSQKFKGIPFEIPVYYIDV